MIRRFSINFAVQSIFLDVFWVGSGLWFSTLLRTFLNRYSFIQPMPLPIQLPWSLYVVFPIIWVSILATFSVYDGRKHLRAVDEYTTITLASLLAAIAMAGVLYLSYRLVSRALFLSFVLTTYFLFLGWRAAARVIFRLRKDWPDAPRRVLIVGAGPLGVRVLAQLQESGIGNLSCVGFLDDIHYSSQDTCEELLGGLENIRAVIARYSVSDVVIALPHSEYQQMSDVVSQTIDLPVKVWVALGFFDLALYKTNIEDLGGIPTLDLRAAALSDFQLLVKRGFDLLIGTLALMVSLPLMGVVAMAVWLDDGKPVLFKQERVGENGRIFSMYKFRTMVKKAEQMQTKIEKMDQNGNLVHKREDDPRITRLGRFLRRYSLDELPQLFNVVLGNMSLVGPRPELPHLVERYQPWQRKRFAVPPGLTGWWQVTGRSERVMHLHTEDDLFYINNYSLWLDIQILIRTVWMVLVGRGAF